MKIGNLSIWLSPSRLCPASLDCEALGGALVAQLGHGHRGEKRGDRGLHPQVLPNTLQWQGPIADSFDRRLFQSYSHTRTAFRQLERAGMTENPASEPGDAPGRQWAIGGASRLLRAFPDIYDSAQHTE